MTVDQNAASSQQKTTSPTITIADSSGNCSTFTDNSNLETQQTERINLPRFQITLEEPEEEEEDYLQSSSEQQQTKLPPNTPLATNYSSTVIATTPSTTSQMITTVDSSCQSKPMQASNFIITTTASPMQFHQTSIHSKGACDNETQLDKGTSINEQQNNQS